MARRHCSHGRCRPASSSAVTRRGKSSPLDTWRLRLPEMKTCPKCGICKSIDDFHLNRRRSDGRQSNCKSCKSAHAKGYYLDNRETYLARKQTTHGRHRLTDADWDALRDKSGGICEICGLVPPEVIDHDHGCAKHSGERGCRDCVRGLICRPCNMLLGAARDSVATLVGAIEYLNRGPALGACTTAPAVAQR